MHGGVGCQPHRAVGAFADPAGARGGFGLRGHGVFVPRVVAIHGRPLDGEGVGIDEPSPDPRVAGPEVSHSLGDQAVGGVGHAVADPLHAAVSPQPQVGGAPIDDRLQIIERRLRARQRMGNEGRAIKINGRVHPVDQRRASRRERDVAKITAAIGIHRPVFRRGAVDGGSRHGHRRAIRADEPEAAVRGNAHAAKTTDAAADRGGDGVGERIEPAAVETHEVPWADAPHGIIGSHSDAHRRHRGEAILDGPPADGVAT